jgi:hypothetical protein
MRKSAERKYLSHLVRDSTASLFFSLATRGSFEKGSTFSSACTAISQTFIVDPPYYNGAHAALRAEKT